MTQIKQIVATISLVGTISLAHAQTPPPPELGEATKGTPAIAETPATTPQSADSQANNAQTKDENKSVFSNAKVIEHKRENGQVYLIEIDHPLGAKQYLYENDSDGKIGSSIESSESYESLTEIPKWKLGSW